MFKSLNENYISYYILIRLVVSYLTRTSNRYTNKGKTEVTKRAICTAYLLTFFRQANE